MIIFRKTADLQQYLTQQAAGQTIGLVPTMGALHAGHTSLIERAKSNGGLVICSIFVNPTQFNDKNDYDKYPTSTEQDIAMLIAADCDVLFLPSVEEVYPNGTEQAKTYDFGYLETVFEGAMRPGHFKGVGQVVGRLLEIVQPRYLYMGQKDYQQCMVVTKLVELMGLKDKTQVVICPIVREADGLAMSSRNRRLTEPQRAIAGIIYQCLVSIESKQKNTPFNIVQKECMELMKHKGMAPEYVALANAYDLDPLNDYDANIAMIALIAVRVGDIRLIDNMLINAIV